MLGLTILSQIFLSLAVAILIAWGIAIYIGEVNKAKWFRKRKKFSILGKRGAFGDVVHFGYPCTIQGAFVTIVMLTLMVLSTYLIFTFL